MYNLLIIDDEPLIVDGLKELIPWNEYGIRICGSAYNGESGLKKIRELNPDIVIADIHMPKKTGLEMISEVKEFNKDIHFIILSGYNDFEYVKKGIILGIENYLLKPVNKQELCSTISLTIQKLEKDIKNSSIIKEGKTVVRENILFRWVTGQINDMELEERIDLLNIPKNSLYYSVAVFHSDDKKMKLSISRKIRSLLAKLNITNRHQKLYITDNPTNNNIILFFTGSSHSYKKERSRIVQQLIESFNFIERKLIVVTLGKIVNNRTLIKTSYESVLNLHKYTLLLPNKNILDAEERQPDNTEAIKYKRLDTVKMKMLIQNREMNSLEELLNLNFESLKEINNPKFIQNEVINILLELDLFCKQAHLPDSFFKKERESLIRRILSTDSIISLKEILYKIIDQIIKLLEQKNEIQSPIIRKMLTFVNNNLHEDISLKRIGNELNFSSNYLGHIFRKEIGISFSEYIKKLRIDTAKKMLEGSTKTISEIAVDVGFIDANYFYRVFRNVNGCTPSDYRNNLL